MPEELKRKLAKPSGGHGIQSRVQLEETEAKHEEDDGFDVDDEDDEDIDFEENDDEDDDTRLTPKATLIDDNRLSNYKIISYVIKTADYNNNFSLVSGFFGSVAILITLYTIPT